MIALYGLLKSWGKNKSVVSAFDGIIGKGIDNGVKFHYKNQEGDDQRSSFDINAETVNLIIPSSSIAFKN